MYIKRVRAREWNALKGGPEVCPGIFTLPEVAQRKTK